MKKRIGLLITMIITAFGLAGCNKYVSNFTASKHVVSNNSTSASVKFGNFKGTEVFIFKCKSDQPAVIQYSCKVDGGNMTIYYDCDDTKKELCSLKAGEHVNALSEPIKADKIYLIIEANEKCQSGELNFELVY